MSNASVIRSIYEFVAHANISSVLSLLADAIVWREAENSLYSDKSPYVGREAVAEGVFSRIAADWDNFSMSLDMLLEDSEHVAAFGRYRGIYKGTGTPLNATFVHLWKVRDGKVTEFQQHTDTLQFARVTNTLK